VCYWGGLAVVMVALRGGLLLGAVMVWTGLSKGFLGQARGLLVGDSGVLVVGVAG